MNKYDFLSKGIPFAESERILLRDIAEDEIYDYLYAENGVKNYDEKYAKIRWTALELAEDLFLAIIDKALGKFVGYVGLQHFDSGMPEFAIALVPEYQRNYYASDAIKLVAERTKQDFGIARLGAKIFAENKASIELFKSLGAKLQEDYQAEKLNVADVLKKAYPELMEKYPDLFETAEEDEWEIVYYVLEV